MCRVLAAMLPAVCKRTKPAVITARFPLAWGRCAVSPTQIRNTVANGPRYFI